MMRLLTDEQQLAKNGYVRTLSTIIMLVNGATDADIKKRIAALDRRHGRRLSLIAYHRIFFDLGVQCLRARRYIKRSIPDTAQGSEPLKANARYRDVLSACFTDYGAIGDSIDGFVMLNTDVLDDLMETNMHALHEFAGLGDIEDSILREYKFDIFLHCVAPLVLYSHEHFEVKSPSLLTSMFVFSDMDAVALRDNLRVCSLRASSQDMIDMLSFQSFMARRDAGGGMDYCGQYAILDAMKRRHLSYGDALTLCMGYVDKLIGMNGGYRLPSAAELIRRSNTVSILEILSIYQYSSLPPIFLRAMQLRSRFPDDGVTVDDVDWLAQILLHDNTRKHHIDFDRLYAIFIQLFCHSGRVFDKAGTLLYQTLKSRSRDYFDLYAILSTIHSILSHEHTLLYCTQEQYKDMFQTLELEQGAPLDFTVESVLVLSDENIERHDIPSLDSFRRNIEGDFLMAICSD